jgi:hypothetical protein
MIWAAALVSSWIVAESSSDRSSGCGDPLRRVAKQNLHVFRAPAQRVCFATRCAKAVEYLLDRRELFLRCAGGLLGAGGNPPHRLAQLLGCRRPFREPARKPLGCHCDSVEQGFVRCSANLFGRRSRIGERHWFRRLRDRGRFERAYFRTFDKGHVGSNTIDAMR